jgi:hypothetical protein
MRLVSLDRVKRLLGAGAGFPDDTLLGEIVEGVSAAVQNYLNRDLEDTGSDVTEYASGDGVRRIYKLRRYPIAKVASIHDDTARDFDSSSLVDSDDYAIDEDAGLIEFDYPRWKGNRNLRFVYSGGYEEDEDGILEVPEGIKHAAALQAAETYRRRETFTMNTQSTDLGSVGMPVTFDAMDLTPAVRRLLNPYRSHPQGSR